MVAEWQAAQRSAWIVAVLELAERSISTLVPQHKWTQPHDDKKSRSSDPANMNTSSNANPQPETKITSEQATGSLDLAEAWGLRARAVLALLRSEGDATDRAARKRRDKYLRVALDSLAHTLRIQTRILSHIGEPYGNGSNAASTPSHHSHPMVAETQVRAVVATSIQVGLCV